MQTADGVREVAYAPRVSPVIEPGIDERSTAPAYPALAAVRVEYLQFEFCTAGGSNTTQLMLIFQLTIPNQSGETVVCDAEKIQLKMGDEVLKPLRWDLPGVPVVGDVTIPRDRLMQHVSFRELPHLESRELVVGDEAFGWLAFELPQSMMSSLFGGTVPLPEPWLLSIPLGTEIQELDLRKVELAHGPRCAVHDRCISAGDRDGIADQRIECRRADHATQSLLKEQRSFVILFKDKQVFMDQVAQSRFMSTRPREAVARLASLLGVPAGVIWTVHNLFVGGGTFRGMSPSEADAVMHILRERLGAERVFVQQLRSDSAEVPGAAASQRSTCTDRCRRCLAAARRECASVRGGHLFAERVFPGHVAIEAPAGSTLFSSDRAGRRGTPE